MSFITSELALNEDVSIKVSVRDHYIITDVYLLMQKLVNDKWVTTKYRVQEPYLKFMPLITQCRKEGREAYE